MQQKIVRLTFLTSSIASKKMVNLILRENFILPIFVMTTVRDDN
jgi:hypothetical protein